MLGNTEGGAVAGSFGIHIDSSQYVLFHGSTYNSNEPTNFAVILQTQLAVSTNLPNSQLVFTPGSGEVASWQAGSNVITLTRTDSGDTSTLTINPYGTVTETD